MCLGFCHNAQSARLIIAARCRQIAQGIRAIERIIQTAPPRVRSIQRKACVVDRHNQLGPCDACNFRVHIRSFNRKIIPLRNKVADLCQELLIGLRIMIRSTALNMVGVKLRLDVCALGQKRSVLWPHVGDKACETVPECIGINASTRKGRCFKKCGKCFVNIQPCTLHAVLVCVGHEVPSQTSH